MSKVFNMVGGGGGVTASIFVTGLSEADTVTATNGSKTKTGVWTAKDSVSGFLIDKIKDLGTWTVTATDGVHTMTRNVLVDVITEYEIDMPLDELFITEEWVLRIAIAQVDYSHVPTADEPYANGSAKYVNSGSQGHILIETKNAVNLTNVSKIRIVVNSAYIKNSAYYAFIKVQSDANVLWADNASGVAAVRNSIAEPTTFDIDVSSLSGGYYIGIVVIGGYNPICSHSMEISSIKLI